MATSLRQSVTRGELGSRMIRHGFFQRGAGNRLSPTVSLLTVAVVFAAVGLLVKTVVLSFFLSPGQLTATARAIPLPSIARTADMPGRATAGIAAVALEQNLFWKGGHVFPKREWTTTAGLCEAKSPCVVEAAPRGLSPARTPVATNDRGSLFLPCNSIAEATLLSTRLRR